jgi:hypothetical protein
MVLEIILGILAITLGYTTYNQMQKVERLETWAEEYAEKIVQAQEQIQEIDSTGHFEADDEIGTIFEGIKNTVEELNQITEKDI